MIGKVYALEPDDYEQWLSGGSGATPVASGEKLFAELACNTCHKPDSGGRGPVLQGLAGRLVQLADGSTVVADDNYLRESIMNPQAKIVAGYQPLMPTFQGLVNEEGVLQLLAYIKSLSAASAPAGTPAVAPEPGLPPGQGSPSPGRGATGSGPRGGSGH
jgi:cytochrome c oxidase subunit 2